MATLRIIDPSQSLSTYLIAFPVRSKAVCCESTLLTHSIHSLLAHHFLRQFYTASPRRRTGQATTRSHVRLHDNLILAFNPQHRSWLKAFCSCQSPTRPTYHKSQSRQKPIHQRKFIATKHSLCNRSLSQNPLHFVPRDRTTQH
jgi:hypothetical protein